MVDTRRGRNGGKGMGNKGGKRHCKVLGDNIEGITKPSIRRLARGGGVKKIYGLIYKETRIKTMLIDLSTNMVLHDTDLFAWQLPIIEARLAIENHRDDGEKLENDDKSLPERSDHHQSGNDQRPVDNGEVRAIIDSTSELEEIIGETWNDGKDLTTETFHNLLQTEDFNRRVELIEEHGYQHFTSWFQDQDQKFLNFWQLNGKIGVPIYKIRKSSLVSPQVINIEEDKILNKNDNDDDVDFSSPISNKTPKPTSEIHLKMLKKTDFKPRKKNHRRYNVYQQYINNQVRLTMTKMVKEKEKEAIALQSNSEKNSYLFGNIAIINQQSVEVEKVENCEDIKKIKIWKKTPERTSKKQAKDEKEKPSGDQGTNGGKGLGNRKRHGRNKPKLGKSDYYFKCAFCVEELQDEKALKIHIDSKHSEDLFKFPCGDCGFNAQGPKFLKQHQNEKHGPYIEKNDKGKPTGDQGTSEDKDKTTVCNDETSINSVDDQEICYGNGNDAETSKTVSKDDSNPDDYMDYSNDEGKGWDDIIKSFKRISQSKLFSGMPVDDQKHVPNADTDKFEAIEAQDLAIENDDQDREHDAETRETVSEAIEAQDQLENQEIDPYDFEIGKDAEDETNDETMAPPSDKSLHERSDDLDFSSPVSKKTKKPTSEIHLKKLKKTDFKPRKKYHWSKLNWNKRNMVRLTMTEMVKYMEKEAIALQSNPFEVEKVENCEDIKKIEIRRKTPERPVDDQKPVPNDDSLPEAIEAQDLAIEIDELKLKIWKLKLMINEDLGK